MSDQYELPPEGRLLCVGGPLDGQHLNAVYEDGHPHAGVKVSRWFIGEEGSEQAYALTRYKLGGASFEVCSWVGMPRKQLASDELREKLRDFGKRLAEARPEHKE